MKEIYWIIVVVRVVEDFDQTSLLTTEARFATQEKAKTFNFTQISRQNIYIYIYIYIYANSDLDPN
jgi:hypothetical protein